MAFAVVLIFTPMSGKDASSQSDRNLVLRLSDYNPASYNGEELLLLNFTFHFDSPSNYAEKSPLKQWYSSWLTEDARPARGLASSIQQIDSGSNSSGGKSAAGTEEAYQAWKRLQEERIREQYSLQPNEAATYSSRVPKDKRVPLQEVDGYRYEGDYVVQCLPNRQHGDPCLYVGSREEYFIDDQLKLKGAEGVNPTTLNVPLLPQSSISVERNELAPARARPTPPTVRQQAAIRAPTASSLPPQERRALDREYQICSDHYHKALSLCGSSRKQPDKESVLRTLNIVAPGQYANYLSKVRDSRYGIHPVERCEALEEAASSMTSLNVYYESVCRAARGTCVSVCFEAKRQSVGIDDHLADNVRQKANECDGDMLSFASRGLFNHTEATKVLANANRCKKEIAELGPCARAGDSPECQRHCEQAGLFHPVCERIKALSLKSPSTDPLKAPSRASPSSFQGTANGHGGFNRAAGGAFASKSEPFKGFAVPSVPDVKGQGQLQAYQPRAAQGSRGNHNSSSSQRGPEPTAKGEAKLLNFADEAFNFFGRLFKSKTSRSTAAQNPAAMVRAVSSEQPKAPFNFAKYVFTERVGTDGIKRCYRGAEQILCPDQDIFHAISRRYRQILPHMKQ